MPKPPVSSAKWYPTFTDNLVKVFQDENNWAFFKVIVGNNKPKYFYGETAWSDVPRWLVDETHEMKYWGITD